jgi:hypothetical protein
MLKGFNDTVVFFLIKKWGSQLDQGENMPGVFGWHRLNKLDKKMPQRKQAIYLSSYIPNGDHSFLLSWKIITLVKKPQVLLAFCSVLSACSHALWSFPNAVRLATAYSEAVLGWLISFVFIHNTANNSCAPFPLPTMFGYAANHLLVHVFLVASRSCFPPMNKQYFHLLFNLWCI